MNRTALIVILAAGATIGVVFGAYPGMDIWLASLFYDPQTKIFMLRQWISTARNAGMWIIAAIAAPYVIALVIKLALPQRRLLVSGRAIFFLLATLALGPGLVSNLLLKNYWGRSRPVDIVQFGGQDHFVAWWDPRGDCTANCSFVSGDVSGAIWTLAPAALVPPSWRAAAYGTAAVFGALIGLARMAFGGHFFTDVVFAGLFTYLIIWTVHGWIYRWWPMRLTDESIELAIERHAAKVRHNLAAMSAGLITIFRKIAGYKT